MLIPGVNSLFRLTYSIQHPKLRRKLFGITFPNPVGLAAGFDKNADYLHEFQHLGFGFLEVGTVTPKGQSGNPRPRLFRLKGDQALINRMGFNNQGLEHMLIRLEKRPEGIIVGGNIGKNKVTPNAEAEGDYLKCFNALFDYVDYFTVNVSSPNTPNLRDLQEKEPLQRLLQRLMDENGKKENAKPILLKIAPDLSNSQLDDVLEIIGATQIAGVIATNTTISRDDLATPAATLSKIGAGGLSGKPLQARSTDVIRYLRKHNETLPIIGVGGIEDEGSALEKLAAGADLIQLYTGFIYQGPGLVKRINRAIIKQLDQA